MKAIPGRRFDGETKNWCFPLDPSVAERLMVTVKPEITADVLSWVKAAKSEKAQELITPLKQDAEVLIPWGANRAPWQPEKLGKKGEEVDFKGLFGYQRAFVDEAGGTEATTRVAKLLADDMGLGKCGQSSSALYEFLLRTQSAFASQLDMPVDSFESAADMLAWAGVQDKPKLVISPASVKGSWKRELIMWLGQNNPLQVIDATTPKAKEKQLISGIEENAWIVTNWEQIRVKKEKTKQKVKIVHPITREFLRFQEREVEKEVMRQPLFEETDWIAAIADEAHRAKNRKSLQTKGLWRIDAPFKLALTGTPLMNQPDELWPILKWLYPKEYTSFWRFFDQYVDFYEGQYGKIVTGVKNSDALRFELSTRLIRRTKGEVLDLPEKMRQYVPVKLNKKQRKLYEEAEKQLWIEVEQAIKEGDKDALKFAQAAKEGKLYQIVNGASRIVRLRQVASTPALLGGEDDSAKLDAAVEIIADAQPKQFGVFTEFVGTANILCERLRKLGIKAEPWTGQRTPEERAQLEADFQAGDIDVIVGTIAAMKEGVTLTAADTAIFLERHWTPAVNEQCEDRFHRVGQKNAVTIIILEAEDTVDTQKVSVTNAIKQLIVASVIQKDDVREVRQ